MNNGTLLESYVQNSDLIVLEDMKPMIFEEYGNIKGELVYLEVHKAPLT